MAGTDGSSTDPGTGAALRHVLGALAVWRVAHLVAYEDGPADVVVRLRLWAGDGLLGQLMDCFKCVSVWSAAAIAPLVVRRRGDLPLAVLALSGAACLLQRLEPVQYRPGAEPDAAPVADPGGHDTDEGDDHGLLRLQA